MAFALLSVELRKDAFIWITHKEHSFLVLIAWFYVGLDESDGAVDYSLTREAVTLKNTVHVDASGVDTYKAQLDTVFKHMMYQYVLQCGHHYIDVHTSFDRLMQVYASFPFH